MIVNSIYKLVPYILPIMILKTRLAQLVERRTFNPVVEGSSPSSGDNNDNLKLSLL